MAGRRARGGRRRRTRRRCGTECRSTARSRLSVPRQAAAIVAPSNGCRTAKVKVAEPGQTLDDDVARVAAVRDALGAGGRGPRRRQRRLVGRARRSPRSGSWPSSTSSTSSSRAAPSRSCARSGAASTCRSPPTSRSAGPAIRLLVRDREAADIAVLKVQPLGGVRACLRAGRADRAAGRGVERAGVVGRDRRRGRPGRSAARAALRVRAGDDRRC